MLTARNLECIRGEHRLFSNLSFSVNPGELMFVGGPNGSGKTSLLRLLCGLSLPDDGEIYWNGTDIRKLGGDYRDVMTYLGHLGGIKDDLTAIENLRISCALAGCEIDEDQAADALGQIGLAGREMLPARVLSQGQRRRVALARLLVTRTKLWILDEPLTALDVAAVELIKGILEHNLAKGGMVIMTTHQELVMSTVMVHHLVLS
ncbi:cytochrome c biogenesis heme-transporting ATPase CcmA [Nitrosomonas sp. H1_AOB3]|uniref:cytochrome c biogenesis heme-transporting ATPase CcmA n=1 Tax=Nitrosomonas sp. H1_AOB3 TaxID=2741553 RepID=UPI001935993E|nr:cytochrome c biogenesis heme-transporting ATPase CcmA [Nitrosomonas sp. H1_AOB3]QOJ10355.1 MAG: cytochrome c biogenesis heme-transporting ATPase CcmA [Nitrosomonas sp. H1_AOB3]